MTTKTKEHTQTVLEEMVNAPIPVKAFGKTYEIKKFGLGQTARALEHIGPIKYVLGELIRPQADVVNILLTALQISGESMLGLISVATSEPVEWLEEQDTMEGLEILTAVVEKNADFFSPQNIKRGKEIFARLQSKIPALGGATSTP